MDEAQTPDANGLIEHLRALGERLPFNQHMGVEVLELDVGRAVTALPADDRLANHVGGVHAIAELAPVELAGALAASSRLEDLLEAGRVPVVKALAARYLAPAAGNLRARSEVSDAQAEQARAVQAQGRRPSLEVEIEVVDAHGTVVVEATATFVYVEAG